MTTKSHSSGRVEASIQRHLVAWIRSEYPSIKVVATLNENSRTQIEMGCDVGITDLILLDRHDGVLFVFFLELKTKKGKLSQSQKDWQEDYINRYESANATYDVAYGFSQAKEKIKDWQFALDNQKKLL